MKQNSTFDWVSDVAVFTEKMDRICCTFNVLLFNYFFNIRLTHVYKYIKETPTYVGVGPTRLS
jgi:hypothetical protein